MSGIKNAVDQIVQLSELADKEYDDEETEDNSEVNLMNLDCILNNINNEITNEMNFEEKSIFYKDGFLNVREILELRTSHDAFTRSTIASKAKVHHIVQSNSRSVDRNLANLLINSEFSNNQQFSVNPRISRWQGRKRIVDYTKAILSEVSNGNLFFENICNKNKRTNSHFVNK